MDYDEADRAAALHQEIRREYERREADARAFKADMKEKLRRELVVNRVELLIVMPVSLVSVLARADHLVLVNLVYSAAYATTIFHFLVRFISTVGYEDKLAAFKTKD